MLSRSLSCLWITFFLHLCCYVDSGEAQNAKEGKFLKFGLLHPVAFGRHPSEFAERCPNPARTPCVLFHCFLFEILQSWMFGILSAVTRGRCAGGWQRCSRAVCERPVGGFLRTAVARNGTRIRRMSWCFYSTPRARATLTQLTSLIKNKKISQHKLGNVSGSIVPAGRQARLNGSQISVNVDAVSELVSSCKWPLSLLSALVSLNKIQQIDADP